MSDEAEVLSKAKELPFNERVIHAKWKVRNEAWEEVTSTSKEEGQDMEEWCAGGNAELFIRGVNDTNSAAQASALEALAAVLTKVKSKDAAIASAQGHAICKGLCCKCLSGRPATVKRAKEILLLFAEVGCGDLITESLVAFALGHKVSKVALNAVEVLTEALRTYGAKALDPKPLLKEMPKLFDAKDVKVRTAAKELTAEFCRWIQPSVIREVLLSDVREAMKKDIEALISQNEDKAAAPTKAVRGEEEIAGEAADKGGAQVEEEQEKMAVDAFDLSQPVSILSDLGEFWGGLKVQKWSVRRDALLSLKSKASVPKIEQGDFMPIAKELKRVITSDSNVSCVNAAIDCVEVLAKGLRKGFKSASKLLCPCLLDKFKEKSTAVTRSIHKSLGMCLEMCVTLNDVQDDIVKYIKHKNPKNKVETLKLCAKVLEFPQEASIATKVHDTVLKEAVKATQDSSPGVRDSALQLVIQFAKVAGGVHAIESFLGSIDNARMSKIVQALSGNTKEEKAEAKPPGVAKKEKAVPKSVPKATPQAKERESSEPSKYTKSKSFESRTLKLEGLIDDFTGIVGEETFKGLKSTLWKERLQAVKDIKEKAKDICAESESKLDVLIAGLCQVPGWGDSNFQVLLNVFETFIEILQCDLKISKENVEFMVTGCVEKIADVKLNAKICDVMDKCTHAIDTEFLVMKVVSKSKNHKNPKVLLESMEWILNTLTRTSGRQVSPQGLIEAIKVHLGHNNPNIRLATTNVLGTIIAYRGLENKSYLGEVKPTVMANIDSTITNLRDKGIVPVSPRKKSPKKFVQAKEMTVEVEESPEENADTQLPGGILDKLSDTNWKVRRGALEELKQIAKTRKDAVKANINGLMASLRLRLHDANKNLIILTLEILQHLPRSFEKQWERYAKLIIMEVLKILCDNKKAVREAGMLTLHSWTDRFNVKSMQPHFLIFVSDAKTNVDGKVSVLTFLSEVADGSALQLEDCLHDILTIIADCLLGKALNLRESSSLLLKALTEVFQVEKVKESMKGMSKSQSDCITTSLTKLGYISTGSRTTERRPRTSLSKRSSQSRTARPATAGARMTPSSAVKTAPEPEADSFMPNDDKADRARKCRKRTAVNKPLIEELQRPEHLRTLQAALSQYCTQNLCDHLFHANFKKHCTAVEIVSSLIQDEETFKGVWDNLDLILQWSSYRICEGNMQVLVKILDLMDGLSTTLRSKGYQLTDYEASLIVPCLVEKCGHNIDRVRQSFKDLLMKLGDICSTKATILMLLPGTTSKNYRTKVVSLEVLENLYESNETEFYSTKIIKEIAVLLSERDIALKNKALALVMNMYKNVGSNLWKYLSSVPDSVRNMLETKFKSLEPTSIDVDYTPSSRTPGSVRRPGSASRTHTPVRNPSAPPGLKFKASPAPKPVDEAAMLWSKSMKRASSEDLPESIEGMKQLCHVLLDFAKKTSDLDVTTLVNSADKLIFKLSEKVAFIFDKAIQDMESSSTRTAEPGSSRGCKYVLNTLMHSFQLSPMAAAVSEPTLRKIMKSLLLLLLNQAVPSLEEGGQLLKALNVLMLKILENANRTSTFLSLLWLLGEGGGDGDKSLRTKFSDLSIKCTIKMVKNLSASIEEGLNLEAIMNAVNEFLGSLEKPAMRERLAQDDKPLRMVKTILHELCKCVGKDIYGSMLQIPRSQDKKQLIYTYVDLYTSMTSTVRTASQNNANVDTRPLQARREELAGIFQKIGEGEGVGLQDLYKFTQECPHIPIDGHLSKTSESFQKYIRDGLEACARQSENDKENRSSEEVSSKSEQPRRSSYSIEELRQRVERAKALLSTSQNDTKSPASS